MRKVILGAAITLDGYLARRNGSVDFLPPPDPGSMATMSKFFATLDTVIMGRKTFGDGKAGGSLQGPWTTYVFSPSLPPGERQGVVFVNEFPASFMDRLRKRPGKNIFLMGGGELAREFLKADLVDELSLALVPVLLGEGIPLFPSGFPQREFTLVEKQQGVEGLAWPQVQTRAPEGQTKILSCGARPRPPARAGACK